MAFLAYSNLFCFFMCLFVNLSEAGTRTLNTDTVVFRVSLFTDVYPWCLFLKLSLSTSHSHFFPFLSSSTIYIYFQHWSGRNVSIRSWEWPSLLYFSLFIFFNFFAYTKVHLNICWVCQKLTTQISPVQLIDKKIRQRWSYYLPWWRRTQNLTEPR